MKLQELETDLTEIYNTLEVLTRLALQAPVGYDVHRGTIEAAAAMKKKIDVIANYVDLEDPDEGTK